MIYVMKIMIKIILVCLTLCAINAAQGQMIPNDNRLILYKLDGTNREYVLCMNLDSPKKSKTSYMVMGDTFAVQPHGTVCYVVMSNACILQTTFDDARSDKVVQGKIWTDVYKMTFSEHAELIFNNSVVELSKMKIEAPGETNMKTYEGGDALRQLKKIGLEPPEDMDMEKAVGH